MSKKKEPPREDSGERSTPNTLAKTRQVNCRVTEECYQYLWALANEPLFPVTVTTVANKWLEDKFRESLWKDLHNTDGSGKSKHEPDRRRAVDRRNMAMAPALKR